MSRRVLLCLGIVASVIGLPNIGAAQGVNESEG